MKNILLFGAGKSASVLIEYLLANAEENNWRLTVADADKVLIEEKTGHHPRASAVMADLTNTELRKTLIVDSDLVISMMPAFLHILIAKDCLEYRKHLLTASYADDEMRKLANEAMEKGIIFLCETGLDPGIDHMSAVKLIHGIAAEGGTITSFISHCGGLVSPESDNNPWRYKITWNPKNVVLAGKAGAEYLENGEVVKEEYETLFNPDRTIRTFDESVGALSWYPNRNSLSYIKLYGLRDATTFIRTTLRYRDFMIGWKNLIALHLTDETPAYDSDGLSLAGFFAQHFEKYGLTEKLMRELEENKSFTGVVLNVLAEKLGPAASHDKLMVNEQGEMISREETVGHLNALAQNAYDGNRVLEQLYYLGIDDSETLINKGLISAAEGLQFALETKLALAPVDKDMIVMQHEIEYLIAGKKRRAVSSLVVKGKDSIHTAMAKTVGLPLGIAAGLILDGTIKLRGLHIPIIPEIYEPVLAQLAQSGISFTEITEDLI